MNIKQTNSAVVKNEKDKQKTAHMTQHRKLKNVSFALTNEVNTVYLKHYTDFVNRFNH